MLITESKTNQSQQIISFTVDASTWTQKDLVNFTAYVANNDHLQSIKIKNFKLHAYETYKEEIALLLKTIEKHHYLSEITFENFSTDLNNIFEEDVKKILAQKAIWNQALKKLNQDISFFQKHWQEYLTAYKNRDWKAYFTAAQNLIDKINEYQEINIHTLLASQKIKETIKEDDINLIENVLKNQNDILSIIKLFSGEVNIFKITKSAYNSTTENIIVMIAKWLSETNSTALKEIKLGKNLFIDFSDAIHEKHSLSYRKRLQELTDSLKTIFENINKITLTNPSFNKASLETLLNAFNDTSLLNAKLIYDLDYPNKKTRKLKFSKQNGEYAITLKHFSQNEFSDDMIQTLLSKIIYKSSSQNLLRDIKCINDMQSLVNIKSPIEHGNYDGITAVMSEISRYISPNSSKTCSFIFEGHRFNYSNYHQYQPSENFVKLTIENLQKFPESHKKFIKTVDLTNICYPLDEKEQIEIIKALEKGSLEWDNLVINASTPVLVKRLGDALLLNKIKSEMTINSDFTFAGVPFDKFCISRQRVTQPFWNGKAIASLAFGFLLFPLIYLAVKAIQYKLAKNCVEHCLNVAAAQFNLDRQHNYFPVNISDERSQRFFPTKGHKTLTEKLIKKTPSNGNRGEKEKLLPINDENMDEIKITSPNPFREKSQKEEILTEPEAIQLSTVYTRTPST